MTLYTLGLAALFSGRARNEVAPDCPYPARERSVVKFLTALEGRIRSMATAREPVELEALAGMVAD